MGVLEISILSLAAAAIISAHLISRPRAVPSTPPEDHHQVNNRCELLETKLNGVKSDLRKISGEWVDYHSRLDTLIRRGIRLGVLEREAQAATDNEDDHSAPSVAAPSTRAGLVAEFRRKNASTESGS